MPFVLGVLIVTIVAWFALPGGTDVIEEPLRDEGDDLVLSAETWWLDNSRLVGISVIVGIVGAALSWLDVLIGEALACVALLAAIVGTVYTRSQHAPKVVRLTRTELVLPRERIPIASIRTAEVKWRNHGTEINFREYVKRDVELELVTGKRVVVRLPMEEGPGDRFVGVLTARMGERPAPVSAPDRAPLPVAVARESRRDRPE